MLNMIKGMLPYNTLVPRLPSLCIDELDLKDKKCTNKVLGNTLTCKIFPLPLKIKNLLKDVPEEKKKKKRSRYLSLPISPKAKEIHFKILNDIYPCHEFLRKRFNFDKK